MPAPTNTLLIEGTFDELSDELAQYIDNLKNTQSDDSAAIQSEVASLVQQNQRDEALKKLVGAAAVLNSAPEKGKGVGQSIMRMRLTLALAARICSSVQPPSASCAAVSQHEHVPG